MHRVRSSTRYARINCIFHHVHAAPLSSTAAEAMEIFMSITTADGLKTMQDPLNGDPIVSSLHKCLPVVPYRLTFKLC